MLHRCAFACGCGRSSRWRSCLLLALFGVTVGRAYLGEAVDRYAEHGPAGTLVDLNGVAQLRDAFNAGAGTPRLVLLLSPT